MAKTRDYMDYLDEKIEIAPANSQEEYQAAETIAEVLRDHELETTIEEFDSHPMGKLVEPILACMLFVCLIVVGLTEGPVHILLILLSVFLVGLPLYMNFMGTSLFENFGPASQSQNVVALHRATGDKVIKGARPIVIVAHYDTPRTSLLRKGAVARYQAMVRTALMPCSLVVAASLFFQILLFLPAVVRTFMWVIGLIAALPMLVLAIVDIIDHFAACTEGANDNKSGVAALLAIADKIRPMPDRVDEDFVGHDDQPIRRRASDVTPEPAAPQRVEVVEEVKGVRHGADVLASLGILPPSCEVIYQEPRVQVIEEPVAVDEEPLPLVDVDEPAYIDEPQDEEADVAEEPGLYEEASDESQEDEYEDAEYEEAAYEEAETYDEAEYEEAETYDEEQDEEISYDEEDAFDDEDEFAEYDAEEVEDEEGEDYDDDEENWEQSSNLGSWFSTRIANIKEYFSKNRGSDIDIDRGEDRRDDSERDEYDEWIDEYSDADEYEDVEYEEVEEEAAEEEAPEENIAPTDEEPLSEDEAEGDEGDELETADKVASAPKLSALPLIEDEVEETYDEEVLDEEIDEEVDEELYDDEAFDEEVYDEEAYDYEELEDEYDEDEDVEVEVEDETETEVYEDELEPDEYAEEELEEDEEYEEPYDDEEGFDDFEYEDDLNSEYESDEVEGDFEEEYEDEDLNTYEGEGEVPLGIGARIARFFSKIRVNPADYVDPNSDEYDEYEDDDYEEYEEESEDAYEETYEPEEDDVYTYADENPYDLDVDDTYDGELEEDEFEEDEFISYEDEEDLAYDDEYEVVYEDEESLEDIDEDELVEGEYVEDEYDEEDYEEPELEEEVFEEEDFEEERYAPAPAATNPYYDDEFIDVELEFEDEIQYDDEEEEPEEPVEPLPDPNVLHFDREEDDDIAPRDTTGLDTITDSYDLYTGEINRASGRERPEPLDDPSWGVSSYSPARPVMNIARRAALFDLPDPSAASMDPFENDDYDDYDDYEDYEDELDEYGEEEADEGSSTQTYNAWMDDEPYDEPDFDEPEAMNTSVTYEVKKEEGIEDTVERKGFWDDSRSSNWKGGATVRSDLRDEEGAEPLVIDADDLQDAILELGDDFLVAHDIWFVATGASETGHAGMRAFINEHRRDIRGAFLVNLDSIGAGSLSVLVREGLRAPRRADRRLVRMITDIARDLHIALDTAIYSFDERDSATSMRSRVRSVTIAGLDENDLPAYSHTQDDVPENVDPGQVNDVVRIVTELIRRS